MRRRIATFCSSPTRIWAAGDGADRTSDDALEGQLLRARGVDPRRDSRIRRERPNARSSRTLNARGRVRMLADEVCSTEKMVTYCRQSPSKSIIIATEAGCCTGCGASVRTRSSFPHPPNGVRATSAGSKMNTLEKLHDCMTRLEPRVELPDDIAPGAPFR